MMDVRSSFSLSTLKDVLAMRMGRSVAQTVRAYVADPRVAQMIDHFTQYVGSCPDSSPAVLCGIAHMQTQGGVWYPMGGTRAIPIALEKLGRELGVEYINDAWVAGIEQKEGRVSGVTLRDGRRFGLDAVVSNMDSVRTYRELVGGKPAKNFERRRTYEPACSGVVLYLGLNRRYEQLLHHNFIFSRNPQEEFHAIYDLGEPAPDPTCYVAAPAVTDPAVAPAGGEALYVLVHTPYLRPHHDWSKTFPEYRRVILNKLRETAGLEDIEERIVVEHALTPQDIHDRYHVLNGAIYGLASHGKYFGAFKPANRRSDLPGLYLAGGAAHPGPGMPMVLMSGWIAADALHVDFEQSSRRKFFGVVGPDVTCESAFPAATDGGYVGGRFGGMSDDHPTAAGPPAISRFLWGWFSWYARRFVRNHFHALRVGQAPQISDGVPLVLYANHPAWWDPMTAIVLANHYWPGRRHYWPIDALMLKKYPFFAKLGFFGVGSDARCGSIFTDCHEDSGGSALGHLDYAAGGI